MFAWWKKRSSKKWSCFSIRPFSLYFLAPPIVLIRIVKIGYIFITTLLTLAWLFHFPVSLKMSSQPCMSHSGQLMPFAWRILACLDAIEAKYHFKINAEVVKCCYSLKKFSGCRFRFVNRKKDDPLILNNDVVNDRKWKLDYFFVDKASMGKDGSYLLDCRNSKC